ncbi:hypothetical protein ACFC0M_15295 [Streptomyces sp. NPDC056149]|uniref:hypothetical protein n=1 Tax=Streptomyces sp. NPDC056149 TaxID=3345728 RepID=UPI0035D80B51
MAFLKTRTDRSLADSYSSADIARLTGLTRGRVSQLRSADGPEALPAPDAAGSTETRPLWRGETVARWCARTNRRLPSRTASWLLPGPDGPHLRREDQVTLQLRQEDVLPRSFERLPIDVHVARYSKPGSGMGPAVWLATVLTPGETHRLLGRPHGWPQGSPLQHLVHEILSDIEPGPDDLLGTLVLLPTVAEPSYSSIPGDVQLLDLYDADAEGNAEDDVHHRLRRLRPGDAELADLTQAIGHRLPWWPPGCATPNLVAAWTPDTPCIRQHVPPPLADAHAFMRRCESTAHDLDGTLRTSLLELGDALWGQASRGWCPGGIDHAALPKTYDPAIWQVAIEFNLPPAPATNGDFWEGLEWAMDHAPSPRLARDALRYFGDPASAGTVVVDTTRLPEPARAALTDKASPAEPTSSYRAQRVQDALDAHPHTAADTVLQTWPAPAGPAWCATSPGTNLTALHIPRTLPADPSLGTPLEVVLLRTEPRDEHLPAPAIGIAITDQDQPLLLPNQGRATDLAAAIEHAVWHPGEPTLVVGLPPISNEPLTAAVEALVETGPRATPWQELAALVSRFVRSDRHPGR